MRTILAVLLLAGVAPAEEKAASMPEPWVANDALSIHRIETTCSTYILTCEATKMFVVIDAGARILPYIRAHEAAGHTLAALWITHDHGDHLSGLGELAKAVNVPVVAHREARKAIESTIAGWKDWGMEEIAPRPPVMPDTWIEDGSKLRVGKVAGTALFSPGHSPGSVCFRMEDRYLFAGDVLFKGSVGRTDFPGCDHDRFCRSLNEKLWELPDATLVFPGHGDRTTIGEEKRTSWLFQDLVRAARGEEPIPRPWMGVHLEPSEDPPGLRVTEVVAGSPAEAAGLRKNDRLTSFGGVDLKQVSDLWTTLRRSRPGDVITTELLREGEPTKIEFKLGLRPPPTKPLK